MSIANAVASGLHGAFLLARGRPEGLDHVEPDLRGAARSFIAPLICLPAFVALRLMDWTAAGVPPHAAHGFALDLIFYVLGWAAFALASRPAADALGRTARWPRFIAIWNWCNVVQYLLLVVAGVPGLLGAPAPIDQAVQLIALGWALWLEWFATRLALDISRAAAFGLVAMDVAIGLGLAAISGMVAVG